MHMRTFRVAHYKIYWYFQSDLIKLAKEERITLACIIISISILALIANIMTIIVITQRKQRPLFRVCVISLAFSDILYILFTSTYYMAQFMKPYTSLWVLGSTMCCLIPFVQSLTIVANSFTLVIIAFDRYLAVTNVIKEKWQPGLIHSTVICSFVWIFAGLIASGALWNYKCFDVYIVVVKPGGKIGMKDFIYKASMCMAEKLVNRKYYTLIFTCVFTPTTIIFVLLNGIIAKRIWDRRRPFMKQNKDRKKMSLSSSSGNNVIMRNKGSETNLTSLDGNYKKVMTVSSHVPYFSHHRSTTYNTSMATMQSRSANDLRANSSKNLREARHIRMFKVVFSIISIFLFCRLPSWIFLLIKMYSVKSTYNEYWIMHYSFGILVLLNCLLNPLIYTFLSTTLNVWDKIRDRLKCFCRPCLSCRFRGDLKPMNESITEESVEVGQYKQNYTSQRN